MSDARKPSGPPMRTFDYSSHVGPNEKGLHDSAVIAQQLPKPGDAGRETPARITPAVPTNATSTEG